MVFLCSKAEIFNRNSTLPYFQLLQTDVTLLKSVKIWHLVTAERISPQNSCLQMMTLLYYSLCLGTVNQQRKCSGNNKAFFSVC